MTRFYSIHLRIGLAVLPLIFLVSSGMRMNVAWSQEIFVPQSEFFQEFTPAPVSAPSMAAGDQIWLVSTRGINCQSGDSFQVYQFDGCQLVDSTLELLIHDSQVNPHLKNVIHVHGNFTDFDWAFRRGTEVYKNAIARVTARQPVRMIIWSWPSEREAIPLRDFTVKTQRSVYEGTLFRQFLDVASMHSAVLIGYSMGAQSVLTSFEFSSGIAANYQMLLVAPSLSPDFCPMNLGPSFDEEVNRIAILTNVSDRALKNAKRLNRLRHEKFAIDQFSLAENLPVDRHRVEVYETGNEVGHKHSIELYSKSPTFQQILANMLEVDD